MKALRGKITEIVDVRRFFMFQKNMFEKYHDW